LAWLDDAISAMSGDVGRACAAAGEEGACVDAADRRRSSGERVATEQRVGSRETAGGRGGQEARQVVHEWDVLVRQRRGRVRRKGDEQWRAGLRRGASVDHWA
jgi:hypothetical protein